MRQCLPRIRMAFLRDRSNKVPAARECGPAERVALPVSEVRVPNGPGTRQGSLPAADRLLRLLMPLGLCLVGLLWALIVGPGMIARSHPFQVRGFFL